MCASRHPPAEPVQTRSCPRGHRTTRPAAPRSPAAAHPSPESSPPATGPMPQHRPPSAPPCPKMVAGRGSGAASSLVRRQIADRLIIEPTAQLPGSRWRDCLLLNERPCFSYGRRSCLLRTLRAKGRVCLLRPAIVRLKPLGTPKILKRRVGARPPDTVGRAEQIPARDQLLLKASRLLTGQEVQGGLRVRRSRSSHAPARVLFSLEPAEVNPTRGWEPDLAASRPQGLRDLSARGLLEHAALSRKHVGWQMPRIRGGDAGQQLRPCGTTATWNSSPARPARAPHHP